MEGGYVGWEEVYVSSEKGRREIHYYLKKKDGDLDLAVIGKEKSLRHMTYRFLLENNMASSSSSFPLVKLRSRREVVDWLNSFVPGSPSPVSPQMSGGSSDGTEADELDIEAMKNNQLRRLGHYTKEFLWLGTPLTCKKKRKHYQAFRRNGVKISVNEFVYVLAEENKRLLAYLDDLYEDTKGNKMVVVRWFHRSDEVGIDMPHSFNDREIFFSLCHQDLSIECIDGLATVLSPQHYAKFLNEAKHTQLEPFVCHRQYDNDDLKPLDITQVKGYWKQEILRYMFSLSSSRASEKLCPRDVSQRKREISDISGIKPRKRLRLSRDSKVGLLGAPFKDTMDIDDVHGHSNIICLDQQKNDVGKCSLVPQLAAVGTLVEVLSQDSGMRGCWFRATIIKKHKNKVKLRYQDIKDAENEANCLEEWVLASRIAVRDEMGVRIYGRTTIRPSLLCHNNGKVSWVINVGTIVDVWWHDGWWEGIVIQKEPDEKVRVYFPGEKQEAVFCRSDLRQSQEWIGSTWKDLNEKPEVAESILTNRVVEDGGAGKVSSNDKEPHNLVCYDKQQLDSHFGKDNLPHQPQEQQLKKANNNSSGGVFDLSKDDFLSQLKWKSSGKRKQLLQPRGSISSRVNSERTRSHERHPKLVIPKTLKVVEKDGCKSVKVDRDNCKYISDSLFGTSAVVPPLTSLVMSR